MSNPIDSSDDESGSAGLTYRSGAAARLSGVPVETLRVWERRYSVVSPERSPRGHREYSLDEVKRLSVIKQLVDLGNPIGAIAHLSRQELAEMLVVAQSSNNGVIGGRKLTGDGQKLRIAIVAERMGGSLAGIGRHSGRIEVVKYFPNLSAFEAAADSVSADLLVVEITEMTHVDVEGLKTIQHRLNAVNGLVLYRFARHDSVRRLREAGFMVARTPTDYSEVESLCQSAMAQGTPAGLASRLVPDTIAPVRFDDLALERIVQAANAVYCECPRHLVEILRMLASFERYSSQCESRSQADELLHKEIGHATAHARATLELALERIAVTEGLPLPL
jgi:DNA-binding transcriptional MerR regulator